MNVPDFKEILSCQGNLSYTRCSLILNQRAVGYVPALQLLHLIEISRRVKKIVFISFKDHISDNGLDGDELNLHKDIRLVQYLAIHARDLLEIELHGTTAECMIEVMALLPNLTSIDWNQDPFDVWAKISPDDTVISTHPSIKSFKWSSNAIGFSGQVTSTIFKACSNLTRLNCVAPWAVERIRDILVSCKSLTELSVLFPIEYEPIEGMVEQVVVDIAQHGQRLKSVSMCMSYTPKKLDLRLPTTKTALKTIIRRVKYLDLKINAELGDITSLFEASTGLGSSAIDLQRLKIQTNDDDVDMIAKVLKACPDVEKLHLEGNANISKLLMTVSESCHQLVNLNLKYLGRINGSVMRSFLQSLPQLHDFTLRSSLDLLAYESLALYGNNLTCLSLNTANPIFDQI
jgi:hypothetical protein